MEFIVSAVLTLMMISIGVISRRNKQKNKIAAAYLFLVVASASLAVYFNNMYSLVLYGLALLSSLLAFVFALKMKKNYSTQ
ncbi:hypothetical protein [Virgibacillus salexigens]|uniref:Uncharacterized protein n=1 Tax=Virgibacillus massiliensis TaxID=1462526 RepID=A0A024QGM3_9BACI|nr:hypothetical protein [Virgibacillus massiliensis]CDQ41345.1 hypothetical protein BN990_03711 [Virgibacillus massiliensis]